MRVLLIRPGPPRFTIGLKNMMVCEPLELEYIAAGMGDHEVMIHDMILEPNVRRSLRRFKPDVVGTSCYITGVNVVRDLCRLVKDFSPDILTVVGGVHATLVPGDFNDPAIDAVVAGDGIGPMKAIVDHYRDGLPIGRVEGCGIPSAAGVSFSVEPKLSVDCDQMPMPRRDLVERYYHKYYYLLHRPVSITKTTFGCPYRCSFCFCWRMTGGQVTYRSPQSVVDEIESLPARDVYIVDDTFFYDTTRLEAIRSLIEQRGIEKRYLIYSRADFIVRHPDVVRDWSRIGLIACIVGVESPLPEDLNDYRKRISVEQNTEAIRILREHRVDVYASFIVGPDWSAEDFDRLEQYIDETGLYYVIIQPLTPLPATSDFEKYKDQLLVSPDHNEIWDLQHLLLPSRLEPREYYRRIRRIYLRIALNPSRAAQLKLRTVPRVISRAYFRVFLGGLRVLFSWRRAHQHAEILERMRHSRDPHHPGRRIYAWPDAGRR